MQRQRRPATAPDPPGAGQQRRRHRLRGLAQPSSRAPSTPGWPAWLPGPDGERLTALKHLLETFAEHPGRRRLTDFFAVPGVADAADRRDVVLLQAVKAALTKLAGPDFQAAFGGSTDQDDYRWGRLHRVTLDHPLGGAVQHPAGLRRLPAAPGRPARHPHRRRLRDGRRLRPQRPRRRHRRVRLRRRPGQPLRQRAPRPGRHPGLLQPPRRPRRRPGQPVLRQPAPRLADQRQLRPGAGRRRLSRRRAPRPNEEPESVEGDGAHGAQEPDGQQDRPHPLVGVPSVPVGPPSLGRMLASQVRVRLLSGTLTVRVKAMSTAAATAATPQSTRGPPAGATTAVRTIRTEVRGSRIGMTRPKVCSIPCCIRIWGVSSSRATTGCRSAQEADPAPASHPESRRTSVLSSVYPAMSGAYTVNYSAV